MSQVVDKIAPHIQPHLDKVLAMSVDHVQYDEKYKSNIVTPAKVAVSSATSGVTSLIPRFDERFTIAMFHIRDELVIYNDGKVNLIDDYRSRFPSVLEKAGTAFAAAGPISPKVSTIKRLSSSYFNLTLQSNA